MKQPSDSRTQSPAPDAINPDIVVVDDDQSTGAETTQELTDAEQLFWAQRKASNVVSAAYANYGIPELSTQKDKRGRCNKQMHRPTYDSSCSNLGTGDINLRKVNQLCALWCAEAARPFSPLADESHKKLLHPTILKHLPSAKVVSRSIHMIYTAFQDSYREKHVGAMYLGANAWQSPNGHDILSIPKVILASILLKVFVCLLRSLVFKTKFAALLQTMCRTTHQWWPNLRSSDGLDSKATLIGSGVLPTFSILQPFGKVIKESINTGDLDDELEEGSDQEDAEAHIHRQVLPTYSNTTPTCNNEDADDVDDLEDDEDESQETELLTEDQPKTGNIAQLALAAQPGLLANDPLDIWLASGLILDNSSPVNALKWWIRQKRARNSHGGLAKMALDVLSCPATLVDVERAFSFGHAYVSEKRHRLSGVSISRGMAVAFYSKNNLIESGVLRKWKDHLQVRKKQSS
ncbi:hypothetical protein PSTG_13674 [Puccinia striiformis f. sp. tritici PST-78]|uniref:HAT C-terminal dimerisation domain-containing protein n=1 Tax=Puccinia striiformis f. sp. tritici PST-78 TaxID=1165861 RepID=A0A0L0V130_9BASI|nr:hypothetical protein PSTG_13674 [Puccinia striiformis f. sp. tritici PST-78]